eukprot:10072647-Alexandrium_andersonii.AAC.1
MCAPAPTNLLAATPHQRPPAAPGPPCPTPSIADVRGMHKTSAVAPPTTPATRSSLSGKRGPVSASSGPARLARPPASARNAAGEGGPRPPDAHSGAQ